MNPPVLGIGHKYVESGSGESLGSVELPRTEPDTADMPNVPALPVEQLDAAVTCVCDVQVAGGVDGHSRWIHKLAGADALTAYYPIEFQ